MRDAVGDGPFICKRCIGQDELQDWVARNAVSRECSFCGRRARKPIAAEADELVSFVEQCLSVEYEDAAEMVPVEGGEYVFDFMNTRELLENEVGIEEVNEDAFAYLVDGLPDKAWVPVDFFSLHPEQVLSNGWEHFAHAIKHETRYLFFPPRPKSGWVQHDEIRPEDMLAELARVIRDYRLVRRLRKGTLLYRVRPHHASVAPGSIQDLASPPARAVARANRMSPAGISMLYAAMDRETAIAESLDPNGKLQGTLATFELKSWVRIADFVRLPAAPGFFNLDTTRDERGRLNFLHAFAREISRSVSRDQVEHVEYVPTQVVTEYLRFRFLTTGRRRLHGVRYRSTKHDDGQNVALFLGYDDFAQREDWQRQPPVRLQLVAQERVDIS